MDVDDITEANRVAFMRRHEPFLDEDERAALRADYWDDYLIAVAILHGG